jgi:shikimate dehydrogenase
VFRSRGIASSYVPIVTRSLRDTLPLLEQLDARGLSVTMPLKLEALELSTPDACAADVGAANSLRRRNRWESTNTDVAGFRNPLRPWVESGRVRRARVLGSGGAARAALVACRELGLDVEVFARSLTKAAALETAGATLKPWEMRGRESTFEKTALINATPLTGEESPWPGDAALAAALVFDTALGSPWSRLLERARNEGLPTIEPRAMWCAQAATQLAFLAGIEVTPEELEGLDE